MAKNNSPYIPSFIKALQQNTKPLQASFSELGLTETNATSSSSSFKYDPLDYPLKSTQQISLDWSKFENHTFFSSAEVKVNEAFNIIINNFPFDGSKKEVEQFFDSLTGFEKWIFDQFPLKSGALHFSGSWINVHDKSGYLFPDLSKNSQGLTVINPDSDKSFTVEMQVFLPTTVNDNQIIFQKKSAQDTGIALFLSSSISTSDASAQFCVTSGSVRNVVSASLKKGRYNHVCVSLNREDAEEDQLQFFVNESLVMTGSAMKKFGKLNIDNADFVIGSGSTFYAGPTLTVPRETLSGTIDEFRLFHATRSESMQKLYATKGLYAGADLKLYYRFNEPAPPLTPNLQDAVNSIVLDSSGNSLHSYITNFTDNLRISTSTDALNPVVNEKAEFKVVLFPAYPEVVSLNSRMLMSASLYDANNPNIITRLIPQHYLLEGASQDGFQDTDGDAGKAYGGSGIPGQGVWGSTQIVLSFLYIWAKFFDDIKLYIDSFGTLKKINYEEEGHIPDNFLNDMIRDAGMYLPPFFSHSTAEQYAEGDGVMSDVSVEEGSLKKLQAMLTRRILVNLRDVLRSKGTQHSIRSFLRSIGIDPDNSLKIREYGGPTTKMLTSSRDKKMEPGAMVDFLTSSLVTTPPLSGSRTEPGFPTPAGNFIVNNGHIVGTTVPSDGLLTSGSWTVEEICKFPLQKLALISDPDKSQSLMRLTVTGSSPAVNPGLIANVIATKKLKTVPARLKAYIRPGASMSSPVAIMSLDLEGEGIFDGDKWSVSIGCERADEINSAMSSSYFLRAGKSEWGQITKTYITSSYLFENPSGEDNVLKKLSTVHNASGSYVTIGKNQIITNGIGYLFLNDSLNVDDEARKTDFVGWASNLRMWSKAVSEEEWREHVRNYRSLGASDPYAEYNFVNKLTGSFGHLRLDALSKQQELYPAVDGTLKFLDFSLNQLHVSGTGFVSGTRALIGEVFSYGLLSPHFDEAATEDKIRIRSFQDPDMIAESPWATAAPSYLNQSLFVQEEPQDDVRLSIEFSLIDALDRDIVNMFSSLDVLGDAIGSPELMFSPDYPRLDALKDVYFNRLSEKVNFRKFLEFYRWFDSSISTFIDQLLPHKTHYKGTNFVVESHMLERHKNMYRHYENYMGDKRTIVDQLLLQQLTAVVKKY